MRTKNTTKISFITTFYNETESINGFLDSLLTQSKVPDEIILVDAFSIDGTYQKVKQKIKDLKNNKTKIKLLRMKGNRSIGRNKAISSSINNFIACSDVGCILDRNWLKNITTPFLKSNIDVVAGYYKPVTKSIFEQCLAAYTSVMPDKITKDFLPSSRSVAFRKSAWESVGGYPEELDFCEDLVFAKRMKSSGLKFFVSKKSIVYWPQRKNILQAAKQFYNYANGDGMALYVRHSTPFLYGRYLFALILIFIQQYYLLIILVVLYIFWSISKNYKYVRHIKAFFYLPLLQITSDMSVLLGTTSGALKRLSAKRFNRF